MFGEGGPRGRGRRRDGGARGSAIFKGPLLESAPSANRRATRYVTPLREGGSLPAIVEADDDGLYVLKFRGAGQGPRR